MEGIKGGDRPASSSPAQAVPWAAGDPEETAATHGCGTTGPSSEGQALDPARVGRGTEDPLWQLGLQNQGTFPVGSEGSGLGVPHAAGLAAASRAGGREGRIPAVVPVGSGV